MILARLHRDQHVQIKLPAYPGVVLAGEIAEMPTSIDRNTAAARLRVRFLKRVPELRAGMRAEFAFQ